MFIPISQRLRFPILKKIHVKNTEPIAYIYDVIVRFEFEGITYVTNDIPNTKFSPIINNEVLASTSNIETKYLPSHQYGIKIPIKVTDKRYFMGNVEHFELSKYLYDLAMKDERVQVSRLRVIKDREAISGIKQEPKIKILVDSTRYPEVIYKDNGGTDYFVPVERIGD